MNGLKIEFLFTAVGFPTASIQFREATDMVMVQSVMKALVAAKVSIGSAYYHGFNPRVAAGHFQIAAVGTGELPDVAAVHAVDFDTEGAINTVLEKLNRALEIIRQSPRAGLPTFDMRKAHLNACDQPQICRHTLLFDPDLHTAATQYVSTDQTAPAATATLKEMIDAARERSNRANRSQMDSSIAATKPNSIERAMLLSLKSQMSYMDPNEAVECLLEAGRICKDLTSARNA